MSQAWQVALSIIGAVGGLCGLWSLWYARKQTAFMEEQSRKQETQHKEELDWSERFERLARHLSHLTPTLTVRNILLYDSIFPDPGFREALETYIVEADRMRTRFLPRNPQPDELRRKKLRETIIRGEQYIEAPAERSRYRFEELHWLAWLIFIPRIMQR